VKKDVVDGKTAWETMPPAAPASSVTAAAITRGDAEDEASDAGHPCGRLTMRCEPSVNEQLSSATGTDPVRPPAAAFPKDQ
jgi:hypothetical protein